MALIPRGAYGGKNKFPTGIHITTPPTKTTYTAGEALNTSGIVIKATWSDNSETEITSECTFTPSVGSVIYEDTKQIQIAWEWENTIGYTTTQAITVNRALQSIAVTTKPTKLSYYKNETLNLAGMAVTATFTSGAKEIVTASCTSSPAAGTALQTLGNKTVTVSYVERGVTKTASFTISVSVKIVTWAAGTDAEIVDMVAAHDAGVINLQDYWAVGQERKVNLSAMATNGVVGEVYGPQTVTMVLMHAGGKTLANGKTCAYIVGQKNGLDNYGYMNPTDTNSGGWNGCKRRTWCNEVYRNALPELIRGIFKQHKNVTANGSGTSTVESLDYFALPAEKEIFGSTSYANSSAEAGLSQFEYYKTSSNRVKKKGDGGSTNAWWERSPYSGASSIFCLVYSDGTASFTYASGAYLLAPFGCI
ncbi:DUF6273 domain-containing protein [Emergencia sp.]|uniref:DUF6273 domain-containing protein n=1 Tax=Emergencia sp. TaxID=1926557 RepID=UPI003AF1A9B4